MFFPRRTEPLQLREEGLQGLRLSLNTPVVSTQDLPVGPARAAIVVHQEPDGRPNVTVGVRSLRGGEVVLYSYDGDLRQESSVAVGTDAALSFGESMGFLFDDDELQAGGAEARPRALGLWHDLIDEAGGVSGTRPARPQPAALELEDEDWGELSDPELPPGPPGEELMLEDSLDAAAEGPDLPDPADGAAPEAAVAAPAAPLVLSKFRHPAPAAPRAPEAEAPPPTPSEAPAPALPPATGGRLRRRTALARLKLVKRRRSGDAERNWLQRLLAAF